MLKTSRTLPRAKSVTEWVRPAPIVRTVDEPKKTKPLTPPLEVSQFGDDALLTAVEAAQFLRLSEKTLANWRSSGRGPAYIKAGGRIGYLLGNLKHFLTSSTRHSTSEEGVQ